jgi:hypothetical protein
MLASKVEVLTKLVKSVRSGSGSAATVNISEVVKVMASVRVIRILIARYIWRIA